MTQPVAILYYDARAKEWFALAAHGQVIARDRLRAEVIRMCVAQGFRVIEAK